MPVHNFFPERRIWLNQENFGTVQQAENSGRIGQWPRDPAIGYTNETLMKYDLSSLSGVVNSVSLEMACDTAGIQPMDNYVCHLFEQNRVAPAAWSSPPRYDDFNTTSWELTNVILGELFVSGVGTYVFQNSTALKAVVQNWIDNPSSNWGFVIDALMGAVDYWLSVDGTTELVIDIDDVVENNFVRRGIGRGIGRGVGRGM